jgi:hypothetical protein
MASIRMRVPLSRLLPGACAAALLVPAAPAQLVFEPPAASAAGSHARRVLVADVDEDGLPDAVTSMVQASPSFGGPVMLSRGLGDGSFGAPEPILVPLAFALADFDSDGHLDLLCAHGGTENHEAVSVKFGDGTGSFGPALGISVTASMQDPDDAAVGDFDGDGALDVAVHRGIEPFLFGRIMVVFGDGRGGFGTPVTPVPFAGMNDGHDGKLRVGDVNGDGLDDIVYTTGKGSPTLLSNGDGTFMLLACAVGCGVVAERDFVLADVNGDGRADAVTTHRVLLGEADGTLTAVSTLPSSGVPFTVAVGDLDDDGLPDVVLGRNGTSLDLDATTTLGDVQMLRGAGDGTFGVPGLRVSNVPQPRDIALADMDLDGRLDVVVAEFQSPLNVRVLVNHTYGPGSPWLDFGNALVGGNGFPIMLGDGTLVAGQPYSIRLEHGLPDGTAKLFVGLSALFAPFKQGVMVPLPAYFFGPVPLDGTGAVEFAGLFPAGASGAEIWMQWWLPVSGGPAGWAASSGVRALVP